MKPIRRKAAAAATKTGRGPVTKLVHDGPNRSLLGTREPAVHEHDTLADIDRRLQAQAETAGVGVQMFQSNHEGALIDRVQAARTDGARFIVSHPAGLTHASVALRDALTGVDVSFIDVHATNVHAREAFRQHSCTSDKAVGTIAGLGACRYGCALAFAVNSLGG